MRRFSTLFALGLCALSLSGCGKSPEQAQNNAPPSAETAAGVKVSMTEPVEIVNRFLDALRRGGADNQAELLLTAAARAECARKEIRVQPVGSPDARFEVTRGEPVPGRSDAALVHCVWTEPTADGKTESNEIVWALKMQPREGWRISGMIIEADEGEPIAVDFENGDELFSQLMGTAPAAQTAAAPAASAPPATR